MILKGDLEGKGIGKFLSGGNPKAILKQSAGFTKKKKVD